MKEPVFDIFSGTHDENSLWVEAVAGLSNARERMEQIAREKPGKYFLFSSTDHAVLLRIETFERREEEVLCKVKRKTAG
jgi:hypothetical protein